LAALVGNSTKYFVPPRTLLYFTSSVPIAQYAGQAVVPGRLSLYVYQCTNVVEPGTEMKAMNSKLNSLPEPEPKLQIAAPDPASAPAPFLFTIDLKKLYIKQLWLLNKFFVNCFTLNPITTIKKGNFQYSL
jgi:hypothetical protein